MFEAHTTTNMTGLLLGVKGMGNVLTEDTNLTLSNRNRHLALHCLIKHGSKD
jgi:hypothetical protein